MPRHIARILLVADRRQDLAEGWRKAGFTLAAGGAGASLADGVSVDFSGAGCASIGLSGDLDAASAPAPAALDGADACFGLVAAPILSTPHQALAAPDHENGATALRAVVATAESPADHAEYLSALTGQREMLATSAGLEIRLGSAHLDVLSAPAFAYRFGQPPRSGGFHLAGLVFAVRDLAETEKVLRRNGLDPRRQAGRLLAGAVDGVVLAFEQA
jgi:hypothetical protein